eukprot:jgi/Botrbrau1/10506/Bobra.0133s0106.1
MDPLCLGLAFITWMAVFVCIMLFGDNPYFENTPIAGAFWFFNDGIFIFIWSAVEYLCGEWGTGRMDILAKACIGSPNPALQLLYLALLFTGYYLYSRDVLYLLPLPYAPLWHMYGAAVSVGGCVATFLLASLADPGTVGPRNLDDQMALYGPMKDGKECWTCHFRRPARSKHCPICRRCIARFDHHCGWINGCVGLNNTRYFLAFLLCNVLLALYGLVMACVILRGEMERTGAWNSVFRDRRGQARLLCQSPTLILHWCLYYHPTAVLLALVLALVAVLVGSFLGYHLWMVSRGTTTYEAFKEGERRRLSHLEDTAQESSHTLVGTPGAQACPPSSEESPGVQPQGIPAQETGGTEYPGTAGTTKGQMSMPEARNGGPGGEISTGGDRGTQTRLGLVGGGREGSEGGDRSYDRGVWRNFGEVFFPEALLAKARKVR